MKWFDHMSLMARAKRNRDYDTVFYDDWAEMEWELAPRLKEEEDCKR
jgi:hypothetical protein